MKKELSGKKKGKAGKVSKPFSDHVTVTRSQLPWMRFSPSPCY